MYVVCSWACADDIGYTAECLSPYESAQSRPDERCDNCNKPLKIGAPVVVVPSSDDD